MATSGENPGRRRKRKSPSKEHLERQRLGVNARKFATLELIENHQAEFDALHVKYRVQAGLPPESGGKTREELERQKRKAEADLKRLRRLLGEEPEAA